jgi:HlyD family secretion protein
MSTTVEILTNTKQNVLTVPILAVTTRIDSVKTRKEWDKVGENNTEEKTSNSKIEAPKEIVFVAKGDTARIVEVKTGIQDNQYIEIIEGLTADDEVVSAPYSAISRNLKDKSLIRKVKTKEELFKSEK